MINPEIALLYEKFKQDVSKANAEDARHFGFLSRMFSGKPDAAQALFPAFDADVQAKAEMLSEGCPKSAEIRSLAEWMLEQSEAQRNIPSLRYALMAVQRHLIPLVPFLDAGDALYLAGAFEAVFPRCERFPSHVQLIDVLKKQGKE